MSNQPSFSEQRRDHRVNSELLACISIGSQLTLNGQLRDMSLRSAFIKIKNSVFLSLNDEVQFTIQCSHNNPKDIIEGQGRISRIEAAGMAIYFTKMDDRCQQRLRELFNID